MRDLQDYFESLSDIEIINLNTIADAKAIHPDDLHIIVDTIKQIYEAEMDITCPDDDKLIEDLYSNFFLGLTLYSNLRRGDIEITRGRIEIKHGSDCHFKVTETGIKRVEQLINT